MREPGISWGMPDRWNGEWDQKSVGFNFQRGRHWNRGRNSYFALMLSLVGVFMTIGAVGHFSPPTLLGALCVLTSPLAILRSDGAAKKQPDGSRYTPLRTELLWILAAVLLVVGGATLFDVFS
jgi:hypothetical protein